MREYLELKSKVADNEVYITELEEEKRQVEEEKRQVEDENKQAKKEKEQAEEEKRQVEKQYLIDKQITKGIEYCHQYQLIEYPTEKETELQKYIQLSQDQLRVLYQNKVSLQEALIESNKQGMCIVHYTVCNTV